MTSFSIDDDLEHHELGRRQADPWEQARPPAFFQRLVYVAGLVWLICFWGLWADRTRSWWQGVGAGVQGATTWALWVGLAAIAFFQVVTWGLQHRRYRLHLIATSPDRRELKQIAYRGRARPGMSKSLVVAALGFPSDREVLATARGVVTHEILLWEGTTVRPQRVRVELRDGLAVEVSEEVW